jgi:1-acyl-sn-glycerol-3-phosphate acyltransferase
VPNLAFYRTVQVTLRCVGRLFWGVRAEGRERIPETGPVILAATHESFLDPLLMGAYCRRHVWHMARRTLFFSGEGRSRFRTWLGTMSGVIEVDREGGGREALRLAIEKLRAGDAVLLFPEGTRGDGTEVQAFRPGVGLLAVRTGARVVPVSLEGTHRLWGRDRRAPRLLGGPVRIAFGEPATYDETTDPGDAAADIRRRVLELRSKTSDSKRS